MPRVTVGPRVVSLLAPFTTAAEVHAAVPLSDHCPLLLETSAQLPGIDALVAYNLMTRMSTFGEKTNNGWGANESHAEYAARLTRLGQQLGEFARELPERTVFALQEIPTHDDERAHLLASFQAAGAGPAWRWAAVTRTRPNRFSQGVLVRDGLWACEDVTARFTFGAQANRIQVVQLGRVLLANVHFTWGGEHEADLRTLLESDGANAVVILGDFNRALPPGSLGFGTRAAKAFFPTTPTSVTHSKDGGRFAVNDGFILSDEADV